MKQTGYVEFDNGGHVVRKHAPFEVHDRAIRRFIEQGTFDDATIDHIERAGEMEISDADFSISISRTTSQDIDLFEG